MRTTDLKNIILKVFGDREFYGYEVHKVLLSREIKVEISRLYRVLNEMLQEELLEGRWQKSLKGPKRRIYRIRGKGKNELDKIFLDAIETVHMFYGKYLMNLVPKVNVLDRIYSSLIDGLERQSNIACVTSQFTPMHEWFVRTAHKLSPLSQIYLVKQRSMRIDLKLDNLTVLNGSYQDISLKKNFLDLLVIIDLPQKKSLEAALKEWYRVLKQDGKLGILTPAILLQKHEHPMTIGDFVEKHEHETIEKREKIDMGFLLSKLGSFFTKIQEKQLVHMTIIQTSPCPNAGACLTTENGAE